jgi:hypothetical protein
VEVSTDFSAQPPDRQERDCSLRLLTTYPEWAVVMNNCTSRSMESPPTLDFLADSAPAIGSDQSRATACAAVEHVQVRTIARHRHLTQHISQHPGTGETIQAQMVRTHRLAIQSDTVGFSESRTETRFWISARAISVKTQFVRNVSSSGVTVGRSWDWSKI